MFLWITGTGLGWYYYYVFAEALVVILCCCGSVFAACDCFGGFIICVISFVFSLQMFASDDVWSCTPVGVKPNLGEFISTLLKSKADSTSRRYKKEISKFIEFCNSSNVQPVPPFPVTFIVVYLFKVYQSSNSYASLVMAHAALKWFHSFGLSNGANPLDSSICHNLLEAARRNKPVTVKKAPISAEIIKDIIDKFAGSSANLKDIRVACICSLGFAGFFRYDELSNIAPMDLEFFPDHLRVFVPRAKYDIYREGNYVYIKRLANKCCPVVLLERYISMCNIELSSSVSLFLPLLDCLSIQPSICCVCSPIYLIGK